VGGGEHDWAYVLGRLGWLQYDVAIALDVRLVGAAIYVYAIVAGVRHGLTLPASDVRAASAADSV
jgi:hypothetical protein